MDRSRALILFSSLICFSVALEANGQGPTTLQLSTPVERTMGPNQQHEFTVSLAENTLIQLVVEQQGVDVIVKVLSPAGKSLGEFDSPNGNEGPEHVSFVAVTAGGYRVFVSPLDKNDSSTGHFQIKIVELRAATEQEIKEGRNQEVVKAKGLALLIELDGLITQIKSPFTRIKAQVQAAQLLWGSDEKLAAKYFADATTGFKDYLASLDITSQQYPQRHSAVSQLRHEIIQVLAERDPDAALSFLYSTVMPANPYGVRESSTQESMFELSIANQIMRKDPARAIQIARRNLKNGYSTNLLSTVSMLKRQNPELASELINEIVSKLLNDKLLSKNNAANLAIGLLRYGQTPSRRGFLSNPGANTARGSMLSDGQFRELLQKAAAEVLSYSPPSAFQSYTPERDAAWNLLNGLQQMGPELDTIVSGVSAAVEKKMAELSVQHGSHPSKYQIAISNAPVDGALEVIEKAPADQKEQLYLQLANQQANNGDYARAKQILNERVTNLYQRRNSLQHIEQQEIHQALNKGKVDDALRIISGFRTARERAAPLAQIAGQIGPGQKRANAINLLEQARSLLAPPMQAQDQDQMNALLEIARAFSRYDTKRSFEILDPLIDQFNEICAAARTMEGFGPEYYEDEELNMLSGSSLTQIAGKMSAVLGTLAFSNFERARSSTERVRLAEVRLKVYLDIAQQAIQGTAR